MDNYIVSARKYRPDTFDTVVGQHALTTTLKNAIASGKLAHAYLFCGPRGVGKTTCARILPRQSTVFTRKKTAKHVANAKAARLSTRDEAITYTNLTRPQITRLKISAHSSNR